MHMAHSPLNGRHRNAPVVIDARVVCGSGGGPDKTILNSPRFLAGLGYRNVCAYLHPPGDPGFDNLRRKAEVWQAPLVSIPDRGPWDLSVVPALLNLCRRERAAIWHGHDYKSNVLGLMLWRFWPMRLVTTVHGWVHETRRTPLYYWVDRRCLPLYERVVCVSPDLHERVLACGTRPERCVLIENGVDTHDFHRRHAVADAKAKLGINSQRFVIGAIGRLSAEKGFDNLIRAVDRLLGDGCDVELLLVGDGDEASSLRALVRELKREDRVRFVGYRSDVRAIYEALDVYALSSLREGLPNVLLEAMAMQVPVVATRIAGVPRLIQQDVNGWLVEPGDEQELASALARLYRATDTRRRLAAAGLDTIRRRYSFEARMHKMRALYDELLGRMTNTGVPA